MCLIFLYQSLTLLILWKVSILRCGWELNCFMRWGHRVCRSASSFKPRNPVFSNLNTNWKIMDLLLYPFLLKYETSFTSLDVRLLHIPLCTTFGFASEPKPWYANWPDIFSILLSTYYNIIPWQFLDIPLMCKTFLSI